MALPKLQPTVQDLFLLNGFSFPILGELSFGYENVDDSLERAFSGRLLKTPRIKKRVVSGEFGNLTYDEALFAEALINGTGDTFKLPERYSQGGQPLDTTLPQESFYIPRDLWVYAGTQDWKQRIESYGFTSLTPEDTGIAVIQNPDRAYPQFGLIVWSNLTVPNVSMEFQRQHCAVRIVARIPQGVRVNVSLRSDRTGDIYTVNSFKEPIFITGTGNLETYHIEDLVGLGTTDLKLGVQFTATTGSPAFYVQSVEFISEPFITWHFPQFKIAEHQVSSRSTRSLLPKPLESFTMFFDAMIQQASTLNHHQTLMLITWPNSNERIAVSQLGKELQFGSNTAGSSITLAPFWGAVRIMVSFEATTLEMSVAVQQYGDNSAVNGTVQLKEIPGRWRSDAEIYLGNYFSVDCWNRPIYSWSVIPRSVPKTLLAAGRLPGRAAIGDQNAPYVRSNGSVLPFLTFRGICKVEMMTGGKSPRYKVGFQLSEV